MKTVTIIQLPVAERPSGKTNLHQILRGDRDGQENFNASLACRDFDNAHDLQSAFEILINTLTGSNFSLIDRENAETASEQNDKMEWIDADNTFISKQAHTFI